MKIIGAVILAVILALGIFIAGIRVGADTARQVKPEPVTPPPPDSVKEALSTVCFDEDAIAEFVRGLRVGSLRDYIAPERYPRAREPHVLMLACLIFFMSPL